MAVYRLGIFCAALLVGMECRSLTSANLNQAVKEITDYDTSIHFLPTVSVSALEDFDRVINLTNVSRPFEDGISKDFQGDLSRLIRAQGLSLEKLPAEFVAEAANVLDREKASTEWLKQRSLILEALLNGIQFETSSINGLNDIGERESTLQKGNKSLILIGVRNWSDDLEEFLDAESYEGNDNYDKSDFNDSSTSYSLVDDNSKENEYDHSPDRHDPEQLNDMVEAYQNDSGLRKNLRKLCRKHRTAS